MYGHGKAEYFSATLEGLLILLAAIGILSAAVDRLVHPRALEAVGLGLVITAVASLANLLVARTLIREGRRRDSISLEADGQHLMTDVLTSAGVIVGVSVVALTGWQVLDPLLAIVVGANIIWTGFRMMSTSIAGLMDASLSGTEQDAIQTVMREYERRGVSFHALRTRRAAARRFVSVHLLVPGTWNVHDAHHIAEDFERDIRNALGFANVFTHLEPIEDEISMQDVQLDR
jgi:cation diffusion facilitator family transporter